MNNLAWDSIVSNVKNFSFSHGITSFINPYSMLMLKNHVDIVKDIDHWHVDGISLVLALNELKPFAETIERYSFDDTSIAPLIFEMAKKQELKVAIIGTKEEHIRKAVSIIQNKHKINIAYFRNGYFNDKSEEDIAIKEILTSGIDLVVCGMGTPYQEEFLIKLKRAGFSGYGFTCGGYLHQISRKESYYPYLVDKLNIRWAYRIYDEPKLFRRYFIDYSKFFLQFRTFKKRY